MCIADALVGHHAWAGKLMSETKHFKLLALLLCSMTISMTAEAQCSTLVCNGATAQSPLEVAIDGACEVTLIPDVILEAEQICPGTKVLTVRDMQANLIVTGKDLLTFDASSYVGSTLSVTVVDEDSGVFCVGFIRIMDNLAPELSLCIDAQISCIGDTSMVLLGAPQVSDNCDTEVRLTYADQVIPYSCDSLTAGLLERTWLAIDGSGNETTCTQQIVFERPNLTAMVFPADVIRHCDNPSIDPDSTGRPSLDGVVIETGGLCNLSMTYEDVTTPLCGQTEFQVVRTWTVTEHCSGEVISGVQMILILDETGPSITCQDTIYATTEAGQCLGTVILPAPTMTDACDSAPDLVVNTSYGAVGLGPHTFVPVGVHTIQYIAIDECGNTNICTSTLIVEDEEEPTAVCNETIIALPSSGIAQVDALIFDEGSIDNCAQQLYYKVRRMDTGQCNNLNGDDSNQGGTQEWFDDQVTFCCEDVNRENLIMLRVYEIDPGLGPVDPNRELAGGDLFGHFGECMINVEVQDKIAPVINGVKDTIVDCAIDLSDLTIFGLPEVFDNCSYQVGSTVTKDLDECGLGVIRRIFTAVDQSGNQSRHTQIIEVSVEDPYTEADIIWPQNFSSDVCGVSVDPENLPEGFNRPIISAEKCGRLTVHYEDDLYNLSYPACYKIIRRWSVVDWCTYDPENPNDEGRFDHIQVIKVEDNDSPVLSCPENMVIGINKTCDSAIVQMPIVAATDCNPDVLITNDSPYAYQSGADGSGVYPLGQTTVNFTATDRCGNVSTCSVLINVIDNTPPSPVCIVGLSANVAMMGDMKMAMVEASSFNGGSRDNCTRSENLKFTIRRANGTPTEPPTTEQLAFNCSEVGTHLIEFWVTDQAGNSDYCETFISIQDLNGLCPATLPETVGMISGGIATENGEEVEGVNVFIHNGEPFEVQTNEFGYFELADMPLEKDYTIVPQKNGDISNGVSTLDLVRITQHILKVKEFESPYKIIAADVDRSGKITTLDLVQLRKVILNISTQFSNGNRSWRFVDARHHFRDPLNPYAEFFPELMNVNDFEGGAVSFDFVAIKIGDVNNSAKASSISAEVLPRSTNDPIELQVADQFLAEGESVTFQVKSGGLQKILGYQMTLGVDHDALNIEQVHPNESLGITQDHFGLQEMTNGLITNCWYTPRTVTWNEETSLFEVTVRAKRNTQLSQAIYLSSRITPTEAYIGEEETTAIKLAFKPDSQPSYHLGLEVYQNQPNPFQHRTKIPFQLSESGPVILKVFDSAGKLLMERTQEFHSGFNHIWIQAHELESTGIMYYQMSTAHQAITKKMLVMP